MEKELITIATTYDLVEAEMIQNQLEEKGFEVYLADDNIIGVMNLLANAVGGIKIKVPETEADEAAKFVEDFRNAEIDFEEDTTDNQENEN